MCHGIVLTYRCCGKQKNLVFPGSECDFDCDGQIWGARRTAPGRCRSCRLRRLRAQRRNGGRFIQHTRRAKAVLEYFRGERVTPRTDEEMQAIYAAESERRWQQYCRGYRLHPFVVHAGLSNSIISTIRSHFNLEALANPHDPFATIRPQLFDECLRRQAEITATGRNFTWIDRAFTFEMVLDGNNPYPQDRPAHVEEEINALPDVPEITPSESSEEEMTRLLLNEKIVATPVEKTEVQTATEFSDTDTTADDYSDGEIEDDAEYDEHDEFNSTVSFLEWTTSRAASRNISGPRPLCDRIALERDLDDYEHS